MAEVVVRQEDVVRLAAKLDAFAETLDASERAMLTVLLRFAADAWPLPGSAAASDEVTGFALSTQPGGIAVTVPGAPPSAFLGAATDSLISPRDPQSGLPTGQRTHKPFLVVTMVDATIT